MFFLQNLNWGQLIQNTLRLGIQELTFDPTSLWSLEPLSSHLPLLSKAWRLIGWHVQSCSSRLNTRHAKLLALPFNSCLFNSPCRMPCCRRLPTAVARPQASRKSRTWSRHSMAISSRILTQQHMLQTFSGRTVGTLWQTVAPIFLHPATYCSGWIDSRR